MGDREKPKKIGGSVTRFDCFYSWARARALAFYVLLGVVKICVLI